MSQGRLDATANFEGGAFHERFEKGGKSSGTLQIDGGVLRFSTEADGVLVVFPLETIELGAGGAADRLVFVTSPQYPGWSLFTHDRKILKHPALGRLAHTGNQVRGLGRQRWLARGFAFGVLGLLVVAMLLLWMLKDPMVKYAAGKIPLSVEKKIGDAAFAHHTMGRTLLDSKEMKASVAELVGPLLKAIGESDGDVGAARYSFEVHVLEDASVNAFALPGGITVLHTGLILKAETPEEILGVMAHEIAHVTEQHSMRGLIQAAGTTMLLSAVLGDVGGLGGVLINNSSFLLRMSFSREKESEADAVGLGFLVKAGIDPQGMVAFFERLRQIEEEMLADGGMDISVPGMELLSTHPATEQRIADLQKAIDQLSKTSYRKSDFDLQALQELVRKEIE